MKTMEQTIQKLALPPFLRKGLEALRVGSGKDQKYLVRSKLKDQTYDFQPWQFFILEVLPACDSYRELASVFEDRFGHVVTEKEVKELISMYAEKELFGRLAFSHPMVAPYDNMNTSLTPGRRSRPEGVDKERAHAASRDATVLVEQRDEPKIEKQTVSNHGAEAERAVDENVTSLSVSESDALATDDARNDHDGSENQRHLLRAVQKAKMSWIPESGETTTTREGAPAASFPRPTDRSRRINEPASPGERIARSASESTDSPLRNVSESSPNNVEKSLPEPFQEKAFQDDTRRYPGFNIFNPGWLIKLLYPLLSPLWHAIYLLPLLFIAASFLTWRHTALLAADFQLLISNTSFLKHAFFSMVTVNLSVTLVTALVAHGYRAKVGALCIVFYMLFLPRFMVRIGNVQQLLRRELIWLYATPLLLRLGFFSIGILVWFNSRTEYEVLAVYSMAVAFIGAISFFITVNPLVKSSGYHLLASFINEPYLRGKAFKALLNKLRGNVYKTLNSNVLVAYALVSALYTLLIVAAMLYIFGSYLEVEMGTTSVLVIGLIALVLLWRTIKYFINLEEAYERSIQFDRWRKRVLPEKESDQADDKKTSPALKYLRRSILLIVVAAMFLPYTYEPGGNFIVLPNEQQTITAEIAGIIENIDYDGGEFLKKGTVIGQLSYSDYAAQVKIYNARIAQQQAVIDELKSKPRPEEAQLAKAALATQRTQAEFSKGKAIRLQDLYNQGVVSLEDLEDARRIYEVDLDQVQEKLANLELVKMGATPEELAEAEAKLQSFKEERDHYQEKIEQSVFRVPFDGKLITMHLKRKIGSYLNKGEPLAVAEQTNQVKVEIEIPESDISYVKENNEIRCRFHVYHDEDYIGVVKTIDSNVTRENYGKVIKVVTLLENKNEKIKSGMTGYAKITGEEMPFGKVLSLALIRFIKVEAWSWLP